MDSSKQRLCALAAAVACALLAAAPPRRAETLRTESPRAEPFCACCSTPGDWYTGSQRVSDTELAELEHVRLGPSANLYVTEAGFEGVRGISDPAETYTLTHTRSRRNWTLRFADASGKAGTLAFAIPATMTSFGADLQEGGDQGLGPSLYKEWRFEGPVAGTGIFKNGVRRGTRFRLVLQGRGNACPSASDFKSWNLQVYTTRDPLFSFYGPLPATAAAGR